MKAFEFEPKLFTTLKNYTRENFMTDLMAGIIVGIVALPLAIAFGIASGVTPEKGIITAIVAGFIISFLGGSKVQIGGPTGAFIVIIYGIIQEYGIEGLMVATMMAGIILVLLGIFKLGTIIKFIPYPIIIGFTSGIAVTIFTTQIADIFGLNFNGEKVPGDFIGKWILYFHHFDTVNWWNVVVSVASIFIIAITPKFSKKIPGSLVAIVLVTVAVYLMKMYGGIQCIDTIGDRFSIKAQLPEAAVPSLDWEAIKNLFPVAITIAVLGAIESLLSAAVADGVIGDRHDSNTELIAQGIANFVSPIFGGIPATGAIARTMTNINNGGKSPVAGIVHAVVLLLILLFLMPLAQYIPMACLAGVLVIVSYNMSGWRVFKGLLKNPKSDVTVLLITFFLTVIFDLTVAIEVGLVIACVLFMKRVMETTQISVITDEIDPNGIVMYNNIEGIKDFLLKKIQPSCCNKLFRRSLIGNSIFYPINRLEEYCFSWEMIKKSKKYIFLPNRYYNYRYLRNFSITKSDENRSVMNYVEFSKCLEHHILFYFPQLIKEAQYYTYTTGINTLKILSRDLFLNHSKSHVMQTKHFIKYLLELKNQYTNIDNEYIKKIQEGEAICC